MSAPTGRGEWSSQLGFVLAAAGSAIGLGNIWRFPYVAGESGGGAFVFVYLICVVFIALPVMLLEISLGRATQKNPVGAFLTIRPGTRWRYLGYLALITGLGILSYYAVIAGKVVAYCVAYGQSLVQGNAAEYHGTSTITILYFALFLVLTVLVVVGGVQRGIERWAKILMPLLLVTMLGVIVRGLMLPASLEGVKWFLMPDFTKIGGRVILNAMSQAFFSLSLGMGAMLTYGSYLSKKQDVLRCGTWVVVFDTAIAILAGLMIFPAVFALGQNPAGGTTLIFQVLPAVFAEMAGGTGVALLFFFLLSVAALTSTVSLLEVVTAYFVDELNWPRSRAVWVVGGATLLVGIPSALDMAGVAPFSTTTILGQPGFFAAMDFVWGNLSLAFGSLMLCLFGIFVWGLQRAAAEIGSTSPFFSRISRIWQFFVRWVCPLSIVIILATLFGL
jgi:NSS family neurotransmitter:Na+ symporter